MSQSPHLICSFSDTLRLEMCDEAVIINEIAHSDGAYTRRWYSEFAARAGEQHAGSFLSYYDWLRQDATTIIGVRCYLQFDISQFLTEVGHLGYTRVITAEDALEVFFGSSCETNELLSDDKYVSATYLLTASDGKPALALDCNWLREEERTSLRSFLC
jgi:hypothetical protein